MDTDVVKTLMVITNCSEEDAVGLLAECSFDLGTAYALYTSRHGSAGRDLEDLQDVPQPRDSVAVEGPAETSCPYVVSRLDGADDDANEIRGYDADAIRSQSLGVERGMSDMFRGTGLERYLTGVPPFVQGGSVSFDDFCFDALEKDQWIILSIIQSEIDFLCVNRDIWWSEDMEDALGMFSIYQVNALEEEGLSILHTYRLDVDVDIPTLLIINPITKAKETRIPINKEDAAHNTDDVKLALLTFVGEHGSPAQWESNNVDVTYDFSYREKDQVPHAAVESDSVDVFVPDELPKVRNGQRVQEATAMEPTTVESVDISPYEIPAGEKNAFSLRCRLPKEQLTLRLKPEMPLQLLVNYLATRVYFSQPGAYSTGPPTCTLRAGYPPKDLPMDDPEVQLGSCAGLRSGDVVILHVL
uniref:UBX domain-containing protein n=1 Tax=Trypanosoma congolense (strain IL3000) TaxID=1068625 RepID=G0UKI8_TRYCI|nr:conserved hypothetical protein [Trypanosoma congolense IL3000]